MTKKRYDVRLEFKPQDAWIGVFWKRSVKGWDNVLDVWVCLFPCIPIHVTVKRDMLRGERFEW